MIEYTLTDRDLSRCKDIGRERNRTQVSHGVTERKVGPAGGEAIHIIGVKGEYVVCLEYGFPHPRVLTSGDGGVFDYFINGLRVEIKTTYVSGGNLVLPRYKDFRADAVILCETLGVDAREVQIVGWAPRETIKANIRETDLGHGPTLMMPRRFLLPLRGSMLAAPVRVSADNPQYRLNLL